MKTIRRRDLTMGLAALMAMPKIARADTGSLSGEQRVVELKPIHWHVPPQYSTPGGNVARPLIMTLKETGAKSVQYDDSNAVIIAQGAYANYDNVVTDSLNNAALMKDRLEGLGFTTFVWTDLDGDQMSTVLDQVMRTLGHRINSRFFFYYYGHGGTRNFDSDSPRSYILPIDCDNSSDESFYRTAIPLSRFVEYTTETTFKHGLYAFEACYAGAAFENVGTPIVQRYDDYLSVKSKNANQVGSVIITAAENSEEVLAKDAFTNHLADALKGDFDKREGLNTGSDTWDYLQRFHVDSRPFARRFGDGDIVFGPYRSPADPDLIEARKTDTIETWTLYLTKHPDGLGIIEARAGISRLQRAAEASRLALYAAREFIVYFDFKRTDLTVDAQEVIQLGADYAKAGKAKRVVVIGYEYKGVDGTKVYAEKRAKTVIDALAGLGVDPQILAYGLNSVERPQATSDGALEPLDRRVVIDVTF